MKSSFNALGILRISSIVILILIIQTSKAQTPCKYDWSLPQSAELRNRNRPPNIKALPGASFKVRYKTPCNCNSADNQLFAIGPLGVPASAPAFIKLKLKGYDCDGKSAIVTIQSAEGLLPGQYSEDKTFAHFKDWLNITVLRVQIDFTLENKKYSYVSDYESGLDETYIDYKPFSKLASEQENTKNNINDAIKKYNQRYKAAQEALSKVKDRSQRDALLKQLDANHSMFDQYDKQAQTELLNGDLVGLNKTLEKITQQNEELSGIDKKITIAETNKPINNSNISKPTNNNTPTPTNNTVQNSSPANTAQAQANAYLDKANDNNTTGIQQAYNYNLAKLNAAAAGNTFQVQQIQQLQNQQIQQQVADMGNKVVDLIGMFSKKRPQQLTIEESFLKDDIEYVRIIEQVAEGSSRRRDKYGNYIFDEDVVINDEKQNLRPAEMYQNGVVENGKFHNTQKSIEWFIKAANHNSGEALVRLATLAEGNGNCSMAANLFLKASMLIDSFDTRRREAELMEYDAVVKAVKSLIGYNHYGYFTDDHFHIIDCDGYNHRKTNYLQAIYFEYKMLPFNTKEYFAYESQNTIADLFLAGDSTLQQNIPRAIDYYMLTANGSKNAMEQIHANEAMAGIFERGNQVRKNPDAAITYYRKVLGAALTDKKNYGNYIKGAEKAIKRCEKLKEDVAAIDTTNQFEIAGKWKCILETSDHAQRKSFDLTADFVKDNYGFVSGTLTDGQPNGTVPISGFIAGNKIHLFFTNSLPGFKVELDLIMTNSHEIKGTISSFKTAIDTVNLPFSELSLVTFTK